MANELPYFPFYPATFFGDENVRLMDPYEVGLYLMLICHQWSEGSIPADPAKIAKILRLPIKDVQRAWTAVSACFEPSDGDRLVQKRIAIERTRALEKAAQAKRAVETRWSKARNTSVLQPNNDRTTGDDAPVIPLEKSRVEESMETAKAVSPGKRLRPSFPAVDFGDLEGDLTAFFAAAAAERKSGTIAESIVARLRHELAALRTELANDQAFLHGLRAATAKGADNVTYVRKAALGYEADEARPRPRPISKYQEVSDIQRKLAADREKREAAT